MTKSSGPRTEPWGTPQEEVCQEDRSVSHFTRKQRDDTYDLNQLRTSSHRLNVNVMLSNITFLLIFLRFLIRRHLTLKLYILCRV